MEKERKGKERKMDKGEERGLGNGAGKWGWLGVVDGVIEFTRRRRGGSRNYGVFLFVAVFY